MVYYSLKKFPKVHYRVHNSPLLVSNHDPGESRPCVVFVWGQIFISLPSTLRSPKGRIFSFPMKTLWARLSFSVRVTYPISLIFRDLITRIMITKTTHHKALHYALSYILLLLPPSQVRSSSSAPHSRYTFLHSPVTSSLSGPIVFLSNTFSKTLTLCSSLSWQFEFYTNKKMEKLLFYMFWSSFLEMARGKTKSLDTKVANDPWIWSAINFFVHAILIG
jgi:hypothetical protein